MSTVYPGNLDVIPPVSSGGTIASSYANTQSGAIMALEQVLGTNPVPAGYATIAAAVAAYSPTTALYMSQNIQ